MNRVTAAVALAAVAAASAAAAGTLAVPVASAAMQTPRPVAVIGDFGSGSAHEQAVAAMVRKAEPVSVVTVGDNVYDSPDYQGLVGDYYGQWIARKRFWPAVGNHDAAEGLAQFDAAFPYLRGAHVYSTGGGGIRFFVLDSTAALGSESAMQQQRAWLQKSLAASGARWRVVVLHHPPYSSGTVHGSSPELRWPFREWGADLVLAGHEHNYERLVENGLTYVVDGSGGKDLYRLGPAIAGSMARDDVDYGAVLLRASATQLSGEFRTAEGRVVDRWTIAHG